MHKEEFPFQSPSLRGSGRFGTPPSPEGGRAIRVSIPFIAGQWSLRTDAAHRVDEKTLVFQSPSLRGSGRFAERAQREAERAKVSIPFIAGQWSLQTTRPCRAFACPSRFNPLHCGAVVASPRNAATLSSALTSFNPLHCGAVVAS